MAQQDERKELLNRFLREIAQDISTAFFSEEELVEIFDYANDFDDDFARSEVLRYGAMRHPHSDALLVRQGFQYYYHEISPDKILDLIRGISPDYVLGQILGARLHYDMTSDGERLKADMDTILKRVSEFSDEDIIQLIDLAADGEQIDWIIAHREKLLAKSPFKPTCLYEMAEVFADDGRLSEAIRCMEALTDIDPFDVSFWNRLTELYFLANDNDRALQSAEFALALQPEDPKSRMDKARALFGLRTEPDEIIKLVEPLAVDCVKTFGFTAPAQMLASVYSSQKHDNPAALRLLTEVNDIIPDNKEVMTGVVVLSAPDLDVRLRKFKELNPAMTSQEWIEWGMEFAAMGVEGLSLAIAVLETYFSTAITEPGVEKLFSLLYIARDFDKVRYYGELLDNERSTKNITTPLHPEIHLARIMTILRDKKHYSQDDFKDYFDSKLIFPTAATGMEERLLFVGMKESLIRVLQFLESHPNYRPSSLDKVDPFPIIK